MPMKEGGTFGGINANANREMRRKERNERPPWIGQDKLQGMRLFVSLRLDCRSHVGIIAVDTILKLTCSSRVDQARPV